MKTNCLTRAIDQWVDDDTMFLWYNGNHVIALELEYDAGDLKNAVTGHSNDYLLLEEFGIEHIKSSFKDSLSPVYLKLLEKYFEK
jgi:hypothetical protein